MENEERGPDDDRCGLGPQVLFFFSFFLINFFVFRYQMTSRRQVTGWQQATDTGTTNNPFPCSKHETEGVFFSFYSQQPPPTVPSLARNTRWKGFPTTITSHCPLPHSKHETEGVSFNPIPTTITTTAPYLLEMWDGGAVFCFFFYDDDDGFKFFRPKQCFIVVWAVGVFLLSSFFVNLYVLSLF